MSRQAYPKYKPSGIEWLGEIPEHWDILSIKRMTSVPITDGPHETPELLDKGIPFISAEAIKNDKIDFTKMRGFISPKDHARFSKKYKPRRGDIYLIKSGATTGNVAFVDTDDEFNIWSPLAAIRPNPEKAITPFVFFFMKSKNFFESIELGWNYGTQQNIGMDVIENIYFVIPPLEEQRTIADYLDRETARIDALIEKKQRQIELLQEKRAALISHAVTKGLNTNAKMKDSGIEWLGEIPEHWKLTPLKFIVLPRGDAVKTGPFGSQLLSSEMLDGTVKVYNQRNVIDRDFQRGDDYITSGKYDELKAFTIYPGDLLITTRGTIGHCALFPTEAESGILHPCLMRAQPDSRKIIPGYLVMLIQDSFLVKTQLALMSNATTIDVIYSDSFKRVRLPLPPVLEQQEILSKIERETNSLDILLETIRESITRLREYRTALISAAVTGKIDVREEVS